MPAHLTFKVMKKLTASLTLWAVFSLSLTAVAQISIAPTSVFLDKNGIASIYVTNPSDQPQEINIGFLFGYPGNDDLGNLIMVYGDTLREKEHGIGDKLRAFPRAFVLAPQQQQTIRLQLRPDRSMPDGTYFTRLRVTSNNLTAEVGDVEENAVATQVNFKFDQVIPVFYRNGEAKTGLEITEIETNLEMGKLRAIADFKTLGNSPFIGSVTAMLKDQNDKTVAEEQQTTALYFSGKKGLDISLPAGLPSGEYQVEMRFETKRSDIASNNLIQSSPIAKRVYVRIP